MLLFHPVLSQVTARNVMIYMLFSFFKKTGREAVEMLLAKIPRFFLVIYDECRLMIHIPLLTPCMEQSDI